MCIIFPGEDSRLLTVAGTKIFVAALADGRQLTVYENAVAQEKVTEGAAMTDQLVDRVQVCLYHSSDALKRIKT